MRVLMVKNLEEARRLPVRVEEQQAQQLAMNPCNPPRSAGDCRHEIQLTAMVPVELPVLGNLQGGMESPGAWVSHWEVHNRLAGGGGSINSDLRFSVLMFNVRGKRSH